mmetsp:Transcript_4846/g.16729  ORF Transcript_4846/g.16729 Transcript_4846/m.16729 type:complete len:219 (-) Transcript_4846:2078-2734(-)
MLLSLSSFPSSSSSSSASAPSSSAAAASAAAFAAAACFACFSSASFFLAAAFLAVTAETMASSPMSLRWRVKYERTATCVRVPMKLEMERKSLPCALTPSRKRSFSASEKARSPPSFSLSLARSSGPMRPPPGAVGTGMVGGGGTTDICDEWIGRVPPPFGPAASPRCALRSAARFALAAAASAAFSWRAAAVGGARSANCWARAAAAAAAEAGSPAG